MITNSAQLCSFTTSMRPTTPRKCSVTRRLNLSWKNPPLWTSNRNSKKWSSRRRKRIMYQSTNEKNRQAIQIMWIVAAMSQGLWETRLSTGVIYSSSSPISSETSKPCSHSSTRPKRPHILPSLGTVIVTTWTHHQVKSNHIYPAVMTYMAIKYSPKISTRKEAIVSISCCRM